MSLVFENVAGLDDESTRFDGDEETDCRSDLAGSCVDAEHDEYDPTIDDAYVASLSILQKNIARHADAVGCWSKVFCCAARKLSYANITSVCFPPLACPCR